MRVLFSLLLLTVSIIVHAQLETKNWFIHDNHFGVTPAGVIPALPPPPGPFPVQTSSTSISDNVGNLLFASNGQKIIDRNMAVMPALTNVNLTSEHPIIQHIPGTNRYYMFYVSPNSFPYDNTKWTLKYAIVDMSLNNGNGDVTVYNQVIDTSVSKGFSLAQGSNTAQAWLITHRHETDSFYVYSITSGGINLTPIKSRAGTVATVGDYIFQEMRTSPNANIIAAIAYKRYPGPFAATYGFVEVFNFNVATGILSYRTRTRRTFNYFSMFFSLEFSPDSRILYSRLTTRAYGLQPCGFGQSSIVQYNLCYTDSLQFDKYSMRVYYDFQFCNPGLTLGTIQLGANKAIHMPYTGTTVSTINNPNRIGRSCNHVFNSYQLPVSNSGYTFAPYFNHKPVEKAIKNNIIYSGGCYPSPINFQITNDTITSVIWNFGDPGSGANNT